MEGMTFLPQKFGSAKERTGRFFPSYDVSPLIDKHGKVAVRLNPTRIHFADNGFGSRAHDEFFGKFFAADVRDERDFGSKPFDVFRLAHEVTVRNKHREICVYVSCRFESRVHFALNILPDRITVRTDNHRSFNRTVIDEFGFKYDVGVPLRVIGFDVRDLFNEFSFLSHNNPRFSGKIHVLLYSFARIKSTRKPPLAKKT